MPRPTVDFDTLKRLLRFAARRGAQDRLPQVAGSLAFTTLLSLVPLFAVAFALFTAFPVFSTFQSSLQGFLAGQLMPAHVNQQILSYLDQFAAKAKGLTAAGSVFLVITAVMTMMTIESAFNVIWRVRKPRPLAQRVLAYWAVLTFGPLFVGVSLTISSYLFTQSLALTGAGMSPVLRELLAFTAVPLEAMTLTLLYLYLPNCPVAWRDAATGGVAAALAFEIAKRGFGYYIRHIPTYTAVYGAFATIPIFLLWMYLCWFITLAGAMITSALPSIRVGEYRREPFAGSDLIDALELLSRLVEAQQAGRPGYTGAQLALRARCNLETTQRLLTLMDEHGWVARLQNDRDDAPRYVIIANSETFKLGDLFDALVVDRDAILRRIEHGRLHVDTEMLAAALHGEQLEVSIGSLTAQRRGAARGTQAEPVAGTLLERLGVRRGTR